MTTEEQFTMFWSGPFSQWYRSEFEIEGVRFCTAEQYMMYKKAEMFNDVEMQNAIMRTRNPREQKNLGRQVRNFDNNQWLSEAFFIVHDGNYAKFTQNDDLYQILKDTEGTTLVEASPYDTIWGIGLRETDEEAYDRSQWRGTNWLGQVLTKLRDDLIAAEKYSIKVTYE